MVGEPRAGQGVLQPVDISAVLERTSGRAAGTQSALCGREAGSFRAQGLCSRMGARGLCLTSVPHRVDMCKDHSGHESELQAWISIPSP